MPRSLQLRGNRCSLALWALVALCALAALWLTGCGPAAERSGSAAAQVLTAADVASRTGATFVGSTAYAQVRADWLPVYAEDFRAALFRAGRGLSRWDERFDCNAFAAFYVAHAQAGFYADAFHSPTPAQALALAEFWYRPTGNRGGHAIVLALTDRGHVFIEPQTGRPVELTAAERASAYLVKF